jgi:hypothetical protein
VLLGVWKGGYGLGEWRERKLDSEGTGPSARGSDHDLRFYPNGRRSEIYNVGIVER